MNNELQTALGYVLTPTEVVALSDEARKAIATVWDAIAKAAEPDIEAVGDLIHAEICVDRCVGWHDGTALLAAAFGDNNLIRRADR